LEGNFNGGGGERPGRRGTNSDGSPRWRTPRILLPYQHAFRREQHFLDLAADFFEDLQPTIALEGQGVARLACGQ
jgi:hypothetical protein